MPNCAIKRSLCQAKGGVMALAWTWVGVASTSVIVSLIFIDLTGIFSLALHDVVNGSDSQRRQIDHTDSGCVRPPSMVLPLYFSSPNSSRRSVEGSYRRQLKRVNPHNTPSARMRLYDDLLSNGYYTTRLWIGTPPQEFALIVDTGSSVTYVPCSTCKHCGKHQDPRFQPELSSTYQPVRCNTNCHCDNDGVQCTYERRYAEMSSSSGVLGEDVISFGNESELVPQRVVFGCENMETGALYSQRADGIMGLGRGHLGVVNQLVKMGVISNLFSLCYGGMDVGGGAMILGAIDPPPNMVFSHSDPHRSSYYNIELKEIHVAGKPLQVKPSVFDGRHGTVLDSGTTYAYLPEEAFVAFKNAIMKKIHPLKLIDGPDPNYDDVCFSGAGRDVSQLSKTFPEVDMVFGNGHKLSLSPENYLFRHTKVRGAYCLGIFQSGDPTTLLGGIIVRNTLVTYDRKNKKIGFWKTNCSELLKRLHVSGAVPGAPAPVVSYQRNTTIGLPPTLAPSGLPPTLAPSGLPQNILPGGYRVGLITFDLSFSFNYPNMKPNLTELAEFIAHELEVNASQVHLLNFTVRRNDSLIKWAIFPAKSADYISQTTAASIILRLTEHRMHLPERLGSYQLVDWNVEPQMKRTWWQQHFLAVIVGVIVTLLIGLSTFVIRFVWRRRQQAFGTYKPVGTVVPEQELQPI
ncbi:hypothetical protein F0562_027599 [Nyssa sinensis]|uniref:Peptidase A1 domain-containing protein n=1 Tax=Nyssa sinensis TaxID=561372 RepID=A0A5J5B9E3_9ASTE|nr:hypothetical protein F0562_027599 [Nyssa sinensis]